VENSVITGNVAEPSTTVPGAAQCPTGPCPRGFAFGGGIANWGSVTVRGSIVSDNRAGLPGGLASLASGGGIYTAPGGSLTPEPSPVSVNTALAATPNGRFAEGGGITMSAGTTFTMRNSSVDANRASLETAFPIGYPTGGSNANGSAIHADDDVDGTI